MAQVKKLPVLEIPFFKDTKKAQIIKLENLDRFGIEAIKEAFSILFTIEKELAELIKKFTFVKAFQFALSLADYQNLLGVFEHALTEFRNLTDTEMNQVAAYFKQKFDIERDDLEAAIEGIIDLIPRTYTFIKEGILFGGDWMDRVETLGTFLKKK